MKPRIEITESFPVSIFIAGDYEKAKVLCKAYCDEVGFCVTVTPTEYVHTSGQESGVIIGLINYPRFPSTGDAILLHATKLGHRLLTGLNQQSFSIQTPNKTVWYSYREGDVSYE